MTPSNDPNGKPLIYRIADALGVTHLVVAVQHSHIMSEIEGLVSALAGKADTNHTHKLIQYSTTSTDGFAGFTVTGAGSFTIGVQTDKSIEFQFGPTVKASITNSNVDNLARSLRNPDTTPTANSDNLVTSGGVKDALDGKTGISRGNNGWVEVKENGEVEIIGDQSVFIGISDMDGVSVTLDNIANLQRAISNPDSSPTANSTNLVTSGGVKAALDGKAPQGDTEVIFDEGENLFVYLPTYFTNGERQRSFILNYQGDAKALIDLFGCDTYDAVRLLSHDDSIIMVQSSYIAVRVIKQPGGVEQGDVYYIIFDGKNDY